jgi:hypothetical protein
MSGTPLDLGHFKAACEAIVKGGDEIFGWQWDDRLRAALAAFPRSHSPKAHALLAEGFAQCWNKDSIRGASPAVLKIAESVGGLRAGQELFLSDAERSMRMCACWWPWGDGDTISVRIMLLTEGVAEAQEPRPLKEFQSWFGL